MFHVKQIKERYKLKVYKHYQQGFITNEHLHDIYKVDLEEKIDYLYMIYCRKFFQNKKDYYKNVKNKLIELIDKYNELFGGNK